MTTSDNRVIYFIYARALARTKKKLKKSVHLEMRNLKQTELQRLKNRTKGKKRSPDTDDYEKQRLATLKRLKRDEVDLISKQHRLAAETEEERRTGLEAFLKSWLIIQT